MAILDKNSSDQKMVEITKESLCLILGARRLSKKKKIHMNSVATFEL